MKIEASKVKTLKKLNLILFSLVVFLGLSEVSKAYGSVSCQGIFGFTSKKAKYSNIDELVLIANDKVLMNLILEGKIGGKKFHEKFLREKEKNKSADLGLQKEKTKKVKEKHIELRISYKKAVIEMQSGKKPPVIKKQSIESEFKLQNGKTISLTVETADPTFSTKNFTEMAERMRLSLIETSRFLPAKVTDDKLTIILLNEDNNAYHFIDNVHIPYRINFSGKVTMNNQHGKKHPVFMDRVFEHEWGHDVNLKGLSESVFKVLRDYEKNYVSIGDVQNNISKVLTYRNTVSKEGEKIQKKHIRLSGKIKKIEERARLTKEDIKDSEKRKLLEELEEKITKLSALGQEFEINKLKIEEIDKIGNKVLELMAALSVQIEVVNKISGGYNEAFADVVAAMTSGYNNKAIYESLYSPAVYHNGNRSKIKRDKRNNRYRDMAQGVPKDFNETEVHIVMNPMRKHLWDEYMSRPKFRNNEKLYIKALMDAIDQAIVFELEVMGDKYFSVKKRNQLINSLIDIHFKRAEENPELYSEANWRSKKAS